MDVTYREDFAYLDILLYVRDRVHQGYELLTHPLSGSIKPNETPYKSIIISKKGNKLDQKSLDIIEASIETAQSFFKMENTPNWSDRVLEDFRVIDLSLIGNVLDSF